VTSSGTIQPWQVHRSRYVYRDQWIALRSDDCETAAGHTIAPYHVLEYPDWTAVLALTAEGDAVLVREYRHAIGSVMIGLPGGIQDPGETDGAVTARRELEEETGYQVERVVALPVHWSNPATHTNTVRCYLALGAVPTGTRELAPTEEIEVVLLPFEDLLAGVMNGSHRLSAAHAATVITAAITLVRDHGAAIPALTAALRAQLTGEPAR
jgi:ADP-ribose pyrophosphatase